MMLSTFLIRDIVRELPLSYDLTTTDLEEYIALRKGSPLLTSGTLLIQDPDTVHIRCPLCRYSYGILAPFLTTVSSVREEEGVYSWYIDFTFGFQLIENVSVALTETLYERNFTIKKERAADIIDRFIEEVCIPIVLDFVLESTHRVLTLRKSHYCPLL